MRGNEFLDKMGLVDPQYIEAAENVVMKKKNKWIGWIAVAACFCVIVGAATFLRSAEIGKNTERIDDNTASDAQISKPIGEMDTENSENIDTENEKGVYVPRAELPEGETDAIMDMLGVVVYKGGIYTQTELYSDERAYEIEHLVGDYIGVAKGNLNEWSTQEDYALELASSVYGEVYTVKGYDPEFRICVRNEYTWEGECYIMIEFLDRLNDIYLENGADLFEDRLHMRDRILDIHWQSHDDWDWNKGNLKNVSFDEAEWENFLDEVYKGEFVYTYVPENGFYEDKPYSSIYDTPNQVHLILNMDDGTVVRIRLIEGGYVGLDGFGWYFVQIPGEAFNAIYDSCEGTYIEEWIVAR